MKSDSLPRFLFCSYVIISCLEIGENSGFSFSSYRPSNLTRIRRQAKCDGFKCATTDDCIDEEKRCDGTVDCRDGSDEFNDCKEAVQCPGYTFTCDYGACIDADKKCNGKKDCRDNSDEAHCVTSDVFNKVESNCKSDQFECTSGQCISTDDKCNGEADCNDKSDETKETCLNMYCPGYTFKCDYGACVSGYSRCDGNQDCIDNSDEEDCPGSQPNVTQPTVTPKPPPGQGVCTLPDYPDNGAWSIWGGAQGNPGDRVAVNTIIQFTCSTGYKLSTESNLVACMADNWSVPKMPVCSKLCPALYSTDVTFVKCHDSRKIEIKCSEATDGTSATFTCAPYYEPADRAKITRYCDEGSWNLPAPFCQPVCGEKRVTAEPLIVNGQKVQKGDYPWVAAVYQKVGSRFMNVCGGSILTQRIILTAAHCVTNDYGDPIPKENIKVGVGKYYNKYKDTRDTQAQYATLLKLIVHKSYKGDQQQFASDIAFIVTKETLLLSKVVQPVCFHDLPNIHLDKGLVGVITGWGYTLAGGSPSDDLREIPMPYKPDSECYQELPSEWANKYYTYDKMCAGHYNKSIAVCKGDSGGGLVFKNYRDGRYYVHGIVSVGQRVTEGCNIEVSSFFTRVVTHYDWIEEITSKRYS